MNSQWHTSASPRTSRSDDLPAAPIRPAFLGETCLPDNLNLGIPTPRLTAVPSSDRRERTRLNVNPPNGGISTSSITPIRGTHLVTTSLPADINAGLLKPPPPRYRFTSASGRPYLPHPNRPSVGLVPAIGSVITFAANWFTGRFRAICKSSDTDPVVKEKTFRVSLIYPLSESAPIPLNPPGWASGSRPKYFEVEYEATETEVMGWAHESYDPTVLNGQLNKKNVTDGKNRNNSDNVRVTLAKPVILPVWTEGMGERCLFLKRSDVKRANRVDQLKAASISSQRQPETRDITNRVSNN